MKHSSTKYTTTYTREFTATQLSQAAKTAFIADLGGDEGLARRGLKASQIKTQFLSARIVCSVVSRTCALDESTPIVIADFSDD